LPDRVPDIVGPVMPADTTAAQRQLENSIGASDQYFGLLVFGALLASVLWVMARPPRRAGATLSLVLLGGVPAFALAASATDFPGATAIATAATAVLIGAVVTARPAEPA
jgi:FtsH-binding integral membrane protein